MSYDTTDPADELAEAARAINGSWVKIDGYEPEAIEVLHAALARYDAAKSAREAERAVLKAARNWRHGNTYRKTLLKFVDEYISASRDIEEKNT